MSSPSRSLMVAAAIAGLLCGCTRPAVQPEPPGLQREAFALRDWEAVARQIADDMTHAGLLPDPVHPTATAPWREPFYVDVTARQSQFLQEVAASLQAEIVRRGGTVVLAPYGAARLALDVDVVHWAPSHQPPDGTFTAAGLAGGAAVVLGNEPPLTPAAGFGLLAGAGILTDLARTMTPDTETEVAWGARITDGDRVIFAARYPMYIADNDAPLYQPPAAPAPLPLVQLRYAP